ncbi:helix-turn-helix domain-containing protein [Aestuariivivens sediminis]|uniref:helix-turn-helix domain-containing protein n=1 Tax=Aestuariivivens sediminis TaxID=2913557 RepID=UPI0023EEB222|nr:helix-turn-helix domain-containing protein [Aestuariivivens sediminis]
MDKTLTLLFKFRVTDELRFMSPSAFNDNKLFLSSVFNLICNIEKSFPTVQINKQELMNLGRELSNTLEFTCNDKNNFRDEEEFLFSIPIKFVHSEFTQLKRNTVKDSLSTEHAIQNDLRWIALVEMAVHDKIIRNGKTWKTVAEDLNMPQKKLRCRVKKIVGLSLIEFQNKIQFELASDMLAKNEDISISEIAHIVGFRDSKYFSKKFKKHYGLLPSEYRDKLYS